MTKILAFSDTHGSKQALRKIKHLSKLKQPDIIACAGDITVFETGFISILSDINRINKKVLIVHGNHESSSSFKKIKSRFNNIQYIHEKSFSFRNILFVGYGGGGFDCADEPLKKIYKKLKDMINTARKNGIKVIFITHGPPYKTKLDNIRGEHSGSKTLRKFIEDTSPDIVICGHIHENFGKEDFIHKTRIINPGHYGKIIVV